MGLYLVILADLAEQRCEKVLDAMSLCNKTPLLTRQGVADCESISTHAILGKSASCILKRKRTESLNCCLFNVRSCCSARGTALSHEPAPLSLACIVDLSKSGKRDGSIASPLILAAVVLSDCCCRFRSSTVCSPMGMKVLRVRVAVTCGTVINLVLCWR